MKRALRSLTLFLLASLATACGSKTAAPPSSPSTDESASVESTAAPKPAPKPAPNAWFEDVAAEAGVHFTHRSGHDGQRFLLPESAVGGAALFDADGDGDLDLYLVQSAPPSDNGPAGNRLFQNLGDGRFEDISAGSGAADTGYGVGVATGDYNGDGRTDLYITNVGPNVLLRNEGVGDGGRVTFTDVTEATGTGHRGFGSSAAFFDADRDGDYDLYAVNYIRWTPEVERQCSNRMGEPDYCDPNEYQAPAMDVLYRNEGNGTFTDISQAAGLGIRYGNGLGVVVGDWNGDGWSDLFVANDRNPDQLWVNKHNGRFEDQALVAGAATDEGGRAKAGMGTASADLDGDGDEDLLVVNFSDESDSYFQNEGAYFLDATAARGLAAASRPYTRFGIALADFDNDGHLDLYEAAGRVARQRPLFGDDPYAEPNLLFRGGPDRFEEVVPRGGTVPLLTAASRAVASGDMDDDGGIDLLIANRDGPVHLLRNTVPRRGSWISLRVLERSGAHALGAVVRLRVEEREIVRTVRSAASYCAANDPRVHVGLGSATEVRDVRVTWSDGSEERFGDQGANTTVTLRRK